MAFRLISLILSLSLFCQQAGIAYASGELNLANYLSSMRNAAVQPDVFQPARLRYISYDINNNDFKLLLDKGDAKLNNATQELFNYFLIGLALPNDTFWVNLRPDAPENIIDPLLEKTDIGKIFLEADLQLKKDTASLTSPQNPEGKQYWDKLYKKAGELFPAVGGSAFGGENITIPTITRPWIVPNEVIVRETEDSAYIYKATLKVMLEQDHLKDSVTYNFSDPRLKELNEYSSQLIRETIIPKLTREVNSSKRYAQLRQVYYSLVLSRWFKQKYSSLGSARAQGASAPVNSYIALIDSGNLANLNSREPCDKQTYFQAYQKSFKDGEYNLKETIASPSGQSIRSYISGGVGMNVKKLPVNKIYVGITSEKVTGALMSSGSPVIKDVRDDLRKIYSNYYGIEAAVKIIKLFVGEKGEGYIKYLEDTNSSLSVFEGVKDLDNSLKMAFEIFKKANEHKQRDEKGELTHAISVELNKEEFLKEFAILQEKMNRLKENPYRLPWIEEILGQINLFLDEFNDVKDPETARRLREIKIEIGNSTHYIDVNKEWKEGVREFLISKTRQRTGNRRKVIEDAVKKIDEIIEVHQKDGDIESGKTSGSPIEIAFWDGEIQKKRTLSYVPGDKLGAKRREKILNNKPFFMEDKTQSNLDVIEAIEGRNGELLSNIRFAFSESDILEGYIVISKEGNSIAAINAVAGVTQWIETALIIAVIQELADSSPPVYSVKLNNVLRDNPYHRIILRRLSGDNKNPFYDSLHMNQQGEGSAAVYPDDIKRLIKGYYDNILEEVKNENENHQIINKFSISSLTPKESVGNGQMSIAGLTVGGVISRAKKEMEVFFSSLEDWLIPQGLNIDPKQMIADAFAELDKAKSVSETLEKIEALIIKLNNIKKSYIKSLDLDPDSPDKDKLSWSYTVMVLNLITLLNQAGWGSLDANKADSLPNGGSTGSPLTAHILSYEEQEKIIEIKKELSILTIEVAHLLYAYPDLKGHYREVPKKIKEFYRQNDILSLAGIMKEFYGAASKYTQKSGGNAISDKIKEWAEVQDIVNKAIEKINKSIDEDIESEDNQLTEVPPGYGGEKKDYYDDVKMLLKKKDFAGVASWMIQWWLWQNNDIKVREWWEISGELKIINMRSGLPHYFSISALKRGGIDLTDRFMRLKIERVESFADLRLVLPEAKNAQGLDLDKEFRQIEALASSGIVPNSRRILELFSACYSRGEFGQRLSQVISCLKASSAIQEKLAIDSDDDFRMCLLLPEVFSDGS